MKPCTRMCQVGLIIAFLSLYSSGCVTTETSTARSYENDLGMRRTHSFQNIGERNNQLISACGAEGMAVDFVTGNCVSPYGGQVNPRNVASPTAPLPKQSPDELIMRCRGRAVDFVTGRCR